MTPTPDQIDDMWDGTPKITNTVAFKDYILQRMQENPEAWRKAIDKFKADKSDYGDLKNLIDSATQDYRNMQRVKEEAAGIKEYHFDVHHEGFVKHGGEWFLEKARDLFGEKVQAGMITTEAAVVKEAAREFMAAQPRMYVYVRYTSQDERLIKARIARDNTYYGRKETWLDFAIRTELLKDHTPKSLASKASRIRRGV